MPASSPAMGHLAAMALALKRGHRLRSVSKAGRAKARQMAEGMTEEQLRHYTHVKK